MATTWDSEMHDRCEALERKVDTFGGRFDVIDQRFDAIDQRFDAIDQRFASVDQRFDELEARLGRKIDTQMDDVRDLVKKSAEGYGATLEAINRRLEDMQGDWRTRSSDIERVLADHARRIVALEHPTSPRPAI